MTKRSSRGEQAERQLAVAHVKKKTGNFKSVVMVGDGCDRRLKREQRVERIS